MNTYLVLVSMKTPNKTAVAAIKENITKCADGKADLIWFDSAYFGITIQTNKCAGEIAFMAGVGANTEDLRDILIIEAGQDWYARQETKAANWLKAHVGRPRVA